VSGWISRPFEGVADIEAVVELARADVLARLPNQASLHPGDVVWQCWNRRDYENIRLWESDGKLLGWVDFEAPVTMVVQLHPQVDPAGPLFAEMLAWGEGRARVERGSKPVPVAYSMLGEGTVSTTAMGDDTARIAALEARGYRKAERHGIRFQRSLDAIPEARLPPGMQLRHTTDAEISERIDLHRDAWSVWGPSSATVESYVQLRQAPWYDPELDVVVEHGGRLVSYAIAWVDASSGVGIFEPVGTRPSYAGQGLAKQILYEGMRRMRARGMTSVRIGTASVNVKAERCYIGAGFERTVPEPFWGKVIG
jgi:GNAT superfamily N-acetyltransferase